MGERTQEDPGVIATRNRIRALNERSKLAHGRFLAAYRRGDRDAMQHAASERSVINQEIIGLLTAMQTRLQAVR